MQKGAKLYKQTKNPMLSLINFKCIKIIYSRPSSASRTLRDISPMKVLPEAMTKQCLVRCKVRKYYDVNYLNTKLWSLYNCFQNENPSVLHERQHIISTSKNEYYYLSQCTHNTVVPCGILKIHSTVDYKLLIYNIES